MKERNWLDLVRPTAFEKSGNGLTTMVTLEPLERGYGFTLGTALRRVLLSSIAGPAVVSVRFVGKHSDGTVHPSAGEIVLNLKQLALRADETFLTSRLWFDLSGEGPVTAASVSVSEGLEIVDPSQLICQTGGEGLQGVEFVVAVGRGYVPAASQPFAHVPTGFTPVDALHSPVRRVSMHVDSARLGQVLDYDRLAIDIETNGETAIKHASRILHDQLAVFINFEEEEPVTAPQVPDLSASVLRCSSASTIWSCRCVRPLHEAREHRLCRRSCDAGRGADASGAEFRTQVLERDQGGARRKGAKPWHGGRRLASGRSRGIEEALSRLTSFVIFKGKERGYDH